MKRQDVNGVERLAVDQTGGGAATDVNLTQIDGTAASVNVGPVDAGTLRVIEANGSTATLSNVSGNASSVTLLAANTSRIGATIENDSTAVLYVKFGAAAALTSYTVKMVSMAYYEVPYGYSGLITGIWDSATGAARMTEVTA